MADNIVIEETNVHIKMPDNVKMIIKRLEAAGYETVIIGGCVRDSIMGRIPKDWDIATSALPEKIMEIFNDYKIMTAGLKHGTVTIIVEHEPYEITTYRIDGKYTDFRRPDAVSFTSDLAKDILRRDFTINAIAYNGTEIIDLHNGIGDLQSGIIRCVGNPEDRFKEDPLRILRAIRFAKKFNFKIEENTDNAMREHKGLLNFISKERKREEFSQMLCFRTGISGFNILKEYQDILDYVMPEVSKIKKWNNVIDMVESCSDTCEKLAILINAAGINNYERTLHTEMRYSNHIVKSVCNIMMCREEIIANSIGCIRRLLFKYPAEDIMKTINYKYAKTLINGDKKELENLYDIEETFIQVCSNPTKYYYDLKHLEVRGYDLKELGIPDVKIKTYLHGLLELVMLNQIENDREKLLEVAKILKY